MDDGEWNVWLQGNAIELTPLIRCISDSKVEKMNSDIQNQDKTSQVKQGSKQA